MSAAGITEANISNFVSIYGVLMFKRATKLYIFSSGSVAVRTYVSAGLRVETWKGISYILVTSECPTSRYRVQLDLESGSYSQKLQGLHLEQCLFYGTLSRHLPARTESLKVNTEHGSVWKSTAIAICGCRVCLSKVFSSII